MKNIRVKASYYSEEQKIRDCVSFECESITIANVLASALKGVHRYQAQEGGERIVYDLITLRIIGDGKNTVVYDVVNSIDELEL